MDLSVLESPFQMNESVQESQNNSEIVSPNCEVRKTRLRESLGTIAVLIKSGNEKLWPIFEKLEDELLRLEQKERRLSQYSDFQ